MKIRYYPETDSLYVEFKAGPGTETLEVNDNVNIDIDADGGFVSPGPVGYYGTLTFFRHDRVASVESLPEGDCGAVLNHGQQLPRCLRF